MKNQTEERTKMEQEIIGRIPESLLAEVPDHKKEEFCRGLLRYLEKERPELLEEPRSMEETKWSGSLTEATETFAKLVKERKQGCARHA